MDLTGRNILIAEDNATNRFVVEAKLKKLGGACYLANNGEEALSLFQQHVGKIDLILMDISMPMMNGYEAAQAIREYEKSANNSPIPIIALTAHALKEDEQKCIDAGMNGYLPKPFQDKDFLEIVEMHLS